MSYKYSKGSTVQGDIKAADDTQRDTLIDFGEDQIDFQTSGSVRFRINNNGAEVTGSLSVSDTATYNTVEYYNSNTMKFNQNYLGNANGSYFSANEYQKVLTITPNADSQNYQVIGRITAQNAGETHIVYFNAALRSGDPLPDLSWSIFYDEEYNGSRYIDPQLWTKETTTAGFIIAFKTLGTIYGNVTVDVDVVPRSESQKANVVINDTISSEQTSIDSGFTARDMTKVISKKGQETTINTPLTVSGEISAAGMIQPLNTITGATGEVDHDCSNSHVFYHSSIAGNFTPNFTQLDLSNSEITNISIILDQGGTAYLPDAYKVNSTASTLYWEGSAMPTGSANKVDTVDLKILRVSDSYNTFARFHNTIEIASGGGGVSIPNNALLFLDASDANSYGGSGTTWTDLSGQDNHGTLVNTPTWNNTDKLFEFAGNSSQHITVPSGFADFTGGATFFVVADLGVGNNWERLLDFSVGGATNDAFNLGRKQTGTTLTLQYYHVEEGNANKNIQTNQISNNTLASYCITTDGTDAKVYKNGSLVQTISFTATLSNVTRTQNYIGRSRAGGDAYYEGEMAVVGIFNRDLSASEISDLHNHYDSIYSL